MYRKFGKRILDIVLVLIFFALFWWVYIVVGLLVKKKLGSPVIFSQKRPGKDGEIFTIYKFRSMTDARCEKGNILSDEERLPKFGKLLRATSLDEIPGLWNVLKGEMSLVGPRPLRVEYLPRYNKTQARRHEVRSGITGWAQVNGRNAISWERKFEYDIEYVCKYNFLLDIKIIFLTLKKVFVREGVSEKGSVTMSRFIGDKNHEN